MADTRAAQLRRLWLNVHLWIALSLAVLLVPISISGGLLVWHDEIDSVLNPKRYAVSGSRVSLQPSEYLAKGEAAVADDPTKPRATALLRKRSNRKELAGKNAKPRLRPAE